MMIRKRWQLTSTFALLVIAVMSSCGTVPDAAALLHTNPLYLVVPRFVGPEGPLRKVCTGRRYGAIV